MKRKKKRDNCGQFLKFLPRTIWLEDAVNQLFPYKCFCSISISGSPCGWHYLLPTIQTALRRHNYVVTLTLNFVVVFLIPTAPSQASQEYPFWGERRTFLHDLAQLWPPLFYHSQHILAPDITLTPFHSHCLTSFCSSQRYFYFPSQANHHSLEVCRDRGWDGKTETWRSGAVPSHSYLFLSNITWQ